MEDALAQLDKRRERNIQAAVLILVVMEDALARLVKTQRSLSPWVLILVVMEDALALPTPSSFYFKCTVS